MLSDPAIVIVAGNVSAGIIAFMTALYFSKRKEAREVYLNNIAFGEKLCDELYTRCIAYWGTDKTAAIQITN